MSRQTLVIACGALAHEIIALKQLNGWDHLKLQCLPADLHNTPEQIPERLQAMIMRHCNQYEQIFVAYADCGTGGAIDKVLQQQGVERLPGTHCYDFFAGEQVFAELQQQELGTFYLTDFLVRHFERLIIKTFKLDQYPEMRDLLFGHYKRLVYLSQLHDDRLMQQARAAAERLQLDFKHVHTGYGGLASGLQGIPVVRR